MFNPIQTPLYYLLSELSTSYKCVKSSSSIIQVYSFINPSFSISIFNRFPSWIIIPSTFTFSSLRSKRVSMASSCDSVHFMQASSFCYKFLSHCTVANDTTWNVGGQSSIGNMRCKTMWYSKPSEKLQRSNTGIATKRHPIIEYKIQVLNYIWIFASDNPKWSSVLCISWFRCS